MMINKTDSYKIYTIRRNVLADKEVEPGTLRGALAVLETIDWNSVSKTFITQRHLNNWLNTIAEMYDLDVDDVSNGIDYMRAGGFVEYRTRPGQQQIVLAAAQVKEMTTV